MRVGFDGREVLALISENGRKREDRWREIDRKGGGLGKKWSGVGDGDWKEEGDEEQRRGRRKMSDDIVVQILVRGPLRIERSYEGLLCTRDI